MRKFVAVLITILIFLSGALSLSSVSGTPVVQTDNEPDVVKKQLLIESAKVTDIGMQAAKDALVRAFTENITEGDVARIAAEAMVNSGSSEYIEAFGVIVASGEQSALPHGDGSDDGVNQILPGEVVVVDLGARYRGYCTDQTRTFFMGEPTEEMIEVYNITLEAQLASMQAVQTGVLARDVDKVARDIIKSYGYGDNFIHGLGHGIGVYIHMPPVLSPSSNGILFKSTDMAITIEPGIYLTDRWGIRIEDDVMVTRLGFQLITHFPKSLEDAILYPDNITNITEVGDDSANKDDKNNVDFSMIGLGIFILFCACGVALILNRKFRWFKINN
jgi:Xaa-Pro aminopeptidase